MSNSRSHTYVLAKSIPVGLYFRRFLQQTRPSSGFSLLEMVLVIALMGIIGAVVLPNFSMIQTRAKVTALNSSLHTLQVALTTYYLSTGQYPNRDMDIQTLTQALQQENALSQAPTNPFTGHACQNGDTSGRILYHWDAENDRFTLRAFGVNNAQVVSELSN